MRQSCINDTMLQKNVAMFKYNAKAVKKFLQQDLKK